MIDPELKKKLKKIRLEVKGRGLVAEFYSLPPAIMDPPPEMMNWGERFFTFDSESSDALIYKEGLVWILCEGATAEKIS